MQDFIAETGQSHTGRTILRIGRPNGPDTWEQVAYVTLSAEERRELIATLQEQEGVQAVA